MFYSTIFFFIDNIVVAFDIHAMIREYNPKHGFQSLNYGFFNAYHGTLGLDCGF